MRRRQSRYRSVTSFPRSGRLCSLSFISALWTLFSLLAGASGALDDAAMIARLRQHRAGFEAVVAMARQDRGLVRVDHDWTDPADPESVGIPAERIADYRRRLAQLGLPRGITIHADGRQVDFLAASRGFGPRGMSRSYVWSETGEFPDGEVTRNLDRLEASGRRRVWAFRHVDGPWWLHLRVD